MKSNILFIMSDDHAAHAISAYGSRINQTPQIDRIAQGGVRLTSCHCTNTLRPPTGPFCRVTGATTTLSCSHRRGAQK
jgi:arylsulfatase A-like enzyme